MSSYVSAGLRREVRMRADGVCEYCLIHERDTYLGCQVDHVVSEKHSGSTESGNLAYACACHLLKIAAVVVIDPESGKSVPVFHPRRDDWELHFRLDLQQGTIVGLTAVGRATVELLRLNADFQASARKQWMRLGLVP